MPALKVWAVALLAVAGCAAMPGGEPHWPSPLASTTSGVTGTRVARFIAEGGAEIGTPLSEASRAKRASVASEGPGGTEGPLGMNDGARLEQQTVCIGARHWSAGRLGDTILYRYKRTGRRLDVGYFVYWSTERPWGANALSYTVVPALVIDLAYSHFLYVLPGVKDAMHGPADIEGVRVELEDRDGDLHVVGGVADNGTHQPVKLSREDLVDERGRIVLLTDVWSHQLGAHGGGAFAAAPTGDLRCYDRGELRPMTDEVARAFRLGNEAAPRRAKPAWLHPVLATGTAAR